MISDCLLASDTPGVFEVIGTSVFGVLEPSEPLKKSQAVRITTGSPIPSGADAVVQVEDTKLIEEAKQACINTIDVWITFLIGFCLCSIVR